MVQGFEAVSLSQSSRPYSSIPAASSSPVIIEASGPPRLPPISTQAPFQSAKPSLASPRSAQSSGPTSPSTNSPTVPASFFQAQQAKRTMTTSPENILRRSFITSDKENHQHQISSPTRSRPPISALSNSTSPARYEPPRRSALVSALSSDEKWDPNATLSEVSVETMATRATDSTHSSSQPMRSSVDFAKIDKAVLVDFSRNVDATTFSRAQALETDLTPRKSIYQQEVRTHRPTQIDASPRQALASPRSTHQVTSPPLQSIPRYSPSVFTEDLSTSRIDRYSPLPLDSDHMLPPPPIAKDSPPPARQARRARASSVTSGIKMPFQVERQVIETKEEKEARIEREFCMMLDRMQLPDKTVKNKMMGLALPLKEEMLRASLRDGLTYDQSHNSCNGSKAQTKGHQRGRSLNQFEELPKLGQPVPMKKESTFKSVMMRKSKSNSSLRNSSSVISSPATTKRPLSTHSRTTSATSAILRSFGVSSGKELVSSVVGPSSCQSPVLNEIEDPTWWAVRLRSTDSMSIGIKEVAMLRGRLRNEAPGWVNEFLTNGGYVGLLERLKELLEVEWREEQHDDQVLHELLRCFKALTMTACGKRALASRSPTPFLPLADLLFSEKRPGDLPCRQLLVELITSVFEVCPADAQAILTSEWSLLSKIALQRPDTSRRYVRRMKGEDDSEEGVEVFDVKRIETTRDFVRSLMLGPPNESELAKVDFIRNAHRTRPFKKWITELSDCVRDYFWIFCHSQNLYWTLEQINVDEIEAPQVPSGMTGGVEYEAMAYCAAHFRLINAIASSFPDAEQAFVFHQELFESGFERVLLTLRRASLVYYQTLHLELSRYISLARSAQFNLGARVLACLDVRSLSKQELYVLELAKKHQQSTVSASGAPQLNIVL